LHNTCNLGPRAKAWVPKRRVMGVHKATLFEKRKGRKGKRRTGSGSSK